MQVTKSTDILILLLASLGFSQFVDKCPEGTFELTDPTQGKVCGKITEIYVAFPHIVISRCKHTWFLRLQKV
jgi:hypothetical protein